MKKCYKCQKDKFFSDFSRDKTRNDGFCPYCNVCRSIHAKNKYLENKSKGKFKLKSAAVDAKYYSANKAKIVGRNGEYRKEKLKKDVSFRARENVRRSTNRFLKEGVSFSKTLGCSKEVLKVHIESQFQAGMTWENYGQWHIDHRYPLAVAQKEGELTFLKSCHYTNLQPLWAKDNLRKGNRVYG